MRKDFWSQPHTNIYVELYDDYARDLKTTAEITFIKQHFQKQQHLIEFGCGTGRTLIPLLQSGFHIDGLDLSAPMLKKLRQKMIGQNIATTLLQQDLTKTYVSKKYDGAILSQRTLNFIGASHGALGQRRALMNVAASLKKNAMVIINLAPGRPEDFADAQIKLIKTGTFQNSQTGNLVEFWENWMPRSTEQIWDFTNEFREGKNKSRVAMSMRIIFPSELMYLLELTGFEVIKMYGGWDKSPVKRISKDLIITARKK